MYLCPANGYGYSTVQSIAEIDCGNSFFFFSSRRRHTRYWRDWSSDVCSSDLLPLGAERSQLPIGPGLPAVRGEAPAVPDGAVPDRARRPESERVDEVPRDGVGRSIRALADVLPGRRARPQDIDPLAVGPDPDRAVGRPGEREHVDAETGRVGQGRERLGGGGAEWSHGQQGEKCGVRNAECGVIAGDQPVAR